MKLSEKEVDFLEGLLEELFEYSYWDGHAFDKVIAEDLLRQIKQHKIELND